MSQAVRSRVLLVVAATVALFVVAVPSAHATSVFNDGNCPTAGQFARYGFFDDMESQIASAWTHSAIQGSDAWSYPATGNASSGDTVLHAEDLATRSDSTIMASGSVTVGSSGVMMLRFTSAWSFEFNQNANFDGGVVEMSVNGSSTWTDIGSGAYNGSIFASGNNPLSGRAAFVKSSGPQTIFIQRSVSPGSLVRIRFRMGSDSTIGVSGGGWWIDDVGIYDCATDTTSPDTTISGPATGTDTSRPSLPFSANETGVAFQCRVDGGDWQRCFSGRPLQLMANGSRNVEVRAVDPAGNADPTPASQRSPWPGRCPTRRSRRGRRRRCRRRPRRRPSR